MPVESHRDVFLSGFLAKPDTKEQRTGVLGRLEQPWARDGKSWPAHLGNVGSPLPIAWANTGAALTCGRTNGPTARADGLYHDQNDAIIRL